MSIATQPDTAPPSLVARQVEQVCTAFEEAWRSGQPPSLGDYLARVPPEARAVLLPELVGLDLDYRRDRGEEPRWEDYRVWLTVECPAWLREVLGGVAGAAPPASRIGNYELLGELGRGGMGVVYKARDDRLKRLVALKMIRAGVEDEPGQSRRFRIEAESLARLRHPHIVQIYEIGESEGRPYLALEYVEGSSLAARLAGTPLPVAEAAALVETVARAMHAAHQQGIVHRDLKPGNVLLSFSGAGGAPLSERPLNEGVPKITDFGLARLLDTETRQTRTGTVLGTPSYMAPEQAAGKRAAVGPPADVYALGSILYETLTGRPPFLGETVLETLDQVRSREPIAPSLLRPKLPRDLETICLKCLRKEPGRRYASALELADDLSRFRKGEPIHARPVPLWVRAWRWCRREPRLAGAIAGTGVALTVAVAALTVAVAVVLRTAGVVNEQNGRLQEKNLKLDEAKAIAKKFASTLMDLNVPKASVAFARTDSEKPDPEKQALFILAACEQAVQADPNDAEMRNNLADAYYLLGTVYRDRNDYEKQKAAWVKSAGAFDGFAPEQGPDWQGVARVGRAYYNLGVAAEMHGAPEEEIDWQTWAIDALAPLPESKSMQQVRWFLCWAHVGRGNARLKLARWGEALPDWEEALALADKEDRESIRLEGLAYTLARLGEHQKAAAAAEEALAGLPAGGENFLVAAKVFALNAGAAGREEAERYASRAMEYLEKAQKLGAFKSPAAKEEVTKGEEFKALAARADFQAFLRTLGME
jgi:serine/threonine protein kinase